ncbi:MAG: hypothetical protein QOG15_575 [Solirubrobacteraceae bacterium]|nr:hypothetical protein [Solirubrobacteraceae bacterium]
MTSFARAVFAVLVCATFAAFFVAQKLKSRPPIVQHVSVPSPELSPNGDGRHDRVFAAFDLKHADDITVKVIQRDGDEVRTLVADRAVSAHVRQRVKWDGRDDRGREVPDGVYRIRVNLRRQGRAVTLQRNIVKDTRPPRPRVRDIGPVAGPGPELLPRIDGQPARVRFSAPGTHTEVLVFRTDVRPARPVFKQPVRLADNAIRWEWNGTFDGHRRVPAGTYAVIVRSRDLAGNVGSSAPVPPRLGSRQRLPGRAGITVRYLRAQAPAGPVAAGGRTGVAVDSVDKDYRWQLRRVGSATPRKDGRGTKSRVVGFPTPGGKSGLYLFEVRTAGRRTAAPLIVQSGRAQRVLVVLPATTWQGVNPVDDDGDGLPNTLPAGGPVQTSRPYVGGLPDQLRRGEALLLNYLDRQGHRYDLTTDVALARGEGPRIAGHRGVILAGDTRWLDAGVGRALRRYVRDGGRVLTVGTNSLRRSVTIGRDGIARAPTPPTTRDLFGARLAPLAREPLTLVNTVDDIGLFAGTEGQFTGIDRFEETQNVTGGRIVAAAAADDGRRRVIVATRLGKGLVVHPGLPDFALRVRNPGEISQFMESVWTLLALR